MSSDEYEYRYTRKSFQKKERRTSMDNEGLSIADNIIHNTDNLHCSPRTDVDIPSCSCDLDPEGEVTNILHKKCPVITLAQQQLQRLLDETDKVLCDNTRCCRSIYDFLCICREVLRTQNKCLCFLLMLLALAFMFGVIFGAASCGTKLGRFNSPIITCIDNYFISESPIYNKEFRGIV